MRLTYIEAIVAAIAQAMRRSDSVFMMGQDVGVFGGAMSGSAGLYDEFGPGRVRDTPIAESAMVGAAVGAAMMGKRPIVEISFGEFLPMAMNQIVLQAANDALHDGRRQDRANRDSDSGRRRSLIGVIPRCTKLGSPTCRD